MAKKTKREKTKKKLWNKQNLKNRIEEKWKKKRKYCSVDHDCVIKKNTYGHFIISWHNLDP